MENKNLEVEVYTLDELGKVVYSVCIKSRPGESRREKARFWSFTDGERRKHLLMAKIKGNTFAVKERQLEQGEYSRDELKIRAENYASAVRENIGNYI